MPKSIPDRATFASRLELMLKGAQASGDRSRQVRAGDLHAKVTGSQPVNRTPVCCAVMRDAMRDGDAIVTAPPKGDGSNLVIEYMLPR